jgi:hypothetical protein
MPIKRTIVICLSVASLILALGLAFAAGQYGPGVSDTEIKIGNTMPYSGSASALGVFGKSEGAYFAMINDQGGINGRKINFISRDDGYSPPKTVEVVRQLVEEEHVLLLFNTAGTPEYAIEGEAFTNGGIISCPTGGQGRERGAVRQPPAVRLKRAT